ncbi:heavy metal translocating P-type ATPase [cyanobiont of Ornithocercus magnificus]|nr:heavy metal translocating P-type ATPase [cyanobiont of Ornithocercus magnificus]
MRSVITQAPFLGCHRLLVLSVEGMKCGACTRAVERTLLEQPYVRQTSVNLVTRTAWVDYCGDSSKVELLLQALAARGFPARLHSDEGKQELNNKSKTTWWYQWQSLVVALVLLLISILGHLAEGGKLPLSPLGTPSFHAILATGALVGPGRLILTNGLRNALAFTPSMDTLVGLGVGSAYTASLVALIWPAVGWPCFFNEPVMLLGFVLLGRFLEERARLQTGRALQHLVQLQPEVARLCIDDDKVIREVPVSSLKPGDRLQIIAGDRIPVDGLVITGYAAVDVSSLTGEPMPLEAGPGIELSSGMLNLDGTFLMEIQRVGTNTALAQIIQLVEQAQARKAPIQRLADRVAGSFCYGVVTLALATLLFWSTIGTRIWPSVLHDSAQDLVHGHVSLGSTAETPLGLAIQLAITVLVVACPCALGLATPTVITVASGLGARHGWLFRGGDVIERAASLCQVVFDKTGTLTTGRPTVISVLDPKHPGQALRLAASLEQQSRHPLAHALLQEAQRRKLELLTPRTCHTVPGQGLEGELQDICGVVRIGKPEWLESCGINWDKELRYHHPEEIISQQYSLIAVAVDQRLIGIITVADQPRLDAQVAIQRLKQLGLRLWIFSGDRRESVQHLGAELNFDSKYLYWNMLPEDKQMHLQALSASGTTAMVGDGINDAPALAAADLGIAVGTGTAIAQESADLVLMGDRLEALPEALVLARRTMNKIRQNLIWAFSYNLVALPVAAGVLLPKFGLLLSPPLAALLMALSSIAVVVNALTLRLP